jgi:lysozyme
LRTIFTKYMRKKSTASNKFWWLLIVACLALCAGVAYVKFFKKNPHFKYYAAFGIPMPKAYSIHGIDISHHKGAINFNMVRRMNVGGITIQFIYMKATQGTNFIDPYYKSYEKECRKLKIPMGVYHYLMPGIDGAAQAAYFLQHTNFEQGDLIPVLDIEETNGKSKAEIKECVQGWLYKVEQTTGIKPMIYSNADFYNRYLADYCKDYPLWVAHYKTKNQPDVEKKWMLWQHSEEATISGINDRVDMNCFYGNAMELNALKIK